MTEGDIQTKLDIVRDNLDKLDHLATAAPTLTEFTSDFRNVDSALHRLQTTIQALIDIGSYATSVLGLPTPKTSRAILEGLEAHGYLPEGSTGRFGPIVGFRNRVVHLYDRIDEEIVHRILLEEREDLRDLLDLLLATLDRDDKE